MKIVFKGARVIDGTDGCAKENTSLLIEDGKITGIGQSVSGNGDTHVIDASGLTIMPGLIDTHVHFAHYYTGFIPHRPDKRWGYIAAWTVWGMQRMLATGVTSARDLGGLDSGYVDAEESELIKAPRLFGNAVQFMMPTNGTTDWMLPWGGTTSAQGNSVIPQGLPDPHCDGPWECRKRAREVLLAGADVLKIGTGGCLAQRRYRHTNPTFTREEIEVFVDEGRRQGVKVHSHCFGGDGLRIAIESGVDCIEHGGDIDDELIDLMAERATWWVPTFWIYELHSRLEPTQEDRDLNKRFYENNARALTKAHSAGVRIALGSDGGGHDPDNNATQLEMQMMADAGMNTADVIVAATRKGAELIGTIDKTGTLEVGKEADLLVVDGDPLKDIKHLADDERRKLVLKAGEAVGGQWMRTEFSRMLSGSE